MATLALATAGTLMMQPQLCGGVHMRWSPSLPWVWGCMCCVYVHACTCTHCLYTCTWSHVTVIILIVHVTSCTTQYITCSTLPSNHYLEWPLLYLPTNQCTTIQLLIVASESHTHTHTHTHTHVIPFLRMRADGSVFYQAIKHSLVIWCWQDEHWAQTMQRRDQLFSNRDPARNQCGK